MSSSSEFEAETCAPETECGNRRVLFLSFSLFPKLAREQVSDPIDLFAALIEYRVQLSIDTIMSMKSI